MERFWCTQPIPQLPWDAGAYPNCKSEAEMTSVLHTENGRLLFSDLAEEATLKNSARRLDLARIQMPARNIFQEASASPSPLPLSGAAGSVASQGGAGWACTSSRGRGALQMLCSHGGGLLHWPTLVGTHTHTARVRPSFRSCQILYWGGSMKKKEQSHVLHK